jgi:superfamily II DNA helicase RecQ
MYLDPHTIQWFRSRTSQTNVAYQVKEIGAGQPFHRIGEQTIQWIQQRVQQLYEGKVVIYANTIAIVQQIARELQCPAYYSKAVDKKGMLESFRKQRTGVIVATSALGIGIDIPDIRLVIHVGQPRSLLDYGQESGRAGRDGRASQAIMLIDGHGRGWSDPPTIDPQVQEYITGACRRRALDIYLDGTVDGYSQQQCEDGEAICDRCHRMINPHSASNAASEAASKPASKPASEPASQNASYLPIHGNRHSNKRRPSPVPYKRPISPDAAPSVVKRRANPIFPSTAYYQAPIQR